MSSSSFTSRYGATYTMHTHFGAGRGGGTPIRRRWRLTLRPTVRPPSFVRCWWIVTKKVLTAHKFNCLYPPCHENKSKTKTPPTILTKLATWCFSAMIMCVCLFHPHSIVSVKFITHIQTIYITIIWDCSEGSRQKEQHQQPSNFYCSDGIIFSVSIINRNTIG